MFIAHERVFSFASVFSNDLAKTPLSGVDIGKSTRELACNKASELIGDLLPDPGDLFSGIPALAAK